MRGLAARSADARRPWCLYWGSRTVDGFYVDEELRALSRSLDLAYVPVLSGADATWSGRRGWVHSAALEDIANFSTWDVYACGNPLMVERARAEFVKRHLPVDRFFSDAFHSNSQEAG